MDEFLKQIAADLAAGKGRRATVRTLLRAGGFKRRGSDVVKFVRQRLRRFRLQTSPDFATADLDGFVTFQLAAAAAPARAGLAEKQATVLQADANRQLSQPAPMEVHEAASIYELRTPDWVAMKPLNPFSNIATQESGYRLLFQDFATYFGALGRISKRLTIANKGQNRYREDREVYPFFISIDKKQAGKRLGPDDHQFLAELVKELVEGHPKVQKAAERRAEPPASPSISPVAGPTIDLAGMEERFADRMSGALEDIRSTVEESVAGLKADLQTQIEELRHESIRKLAAMQNSDELGQLIEEEHGRYAKQLAERDQLFELSETENQKLRAQLEELERDLYEQLASTEPSEAFATMESTIRLFQEMVVKDPVVVLPSAIKSAGESASKRKLEVLQFLLALRELAINLYKIGSSPGPLREWFSSRGYDYAHQDSETTTTKHGDQRRVLVDGEKVLFKEHVTLFPNSPDCVQVYFLRDAEHRRLLIGYCGSHLQTVSR